MTRIIALNLIKVGATQSARWPPRGWWRHPNVKQICINILPSWKHQQNTRHQNLKFFFFLQTTRLSPSLGGLNSCLTPAAGELWPKLQRPLQWLARTLRGCKVRLRWKFINGNGSGNYFLEALKQIFRCWCSRDFPKALPLTIYKDFALQYYSTWILGISICWYGFRGKFTA